MKSKEELLDYIISNNSSDIDELNIAKVSTWMLEDSRKKESPLSKLYAWEIDELRSILVSLIVDEYGEIPPVDSVFYSLVMSDSTRSVFSEITCNHKMTLTELQPFMFYDTIFNNDVYVKVDSIAEYAFSSTKFNRNVYIDEGCTQLERGCFSSEFNGKIYLPKSITKINPTTFPDNMYKFDILYYAGTVDQFNKITSGADVIARSEITTIGSWPEIVHCSDGDWTSSDYDNNK